MLTCLIFKRTIKETVNEYDDEGKLVKQTFTETTEDDDAPYWRYNPSPSFLSPWWGVDHTVYCDAKQE